MKPVQVTAWTLIGFVAEGGSLARGKQAMRCLANARRRMEMATKRLSQRNLLVWSAAATGLGVSSSLHHRTGAKAQSGVVRASTS